MGKPKGSKQAPRGAAGALAAPPASRRRRRGASEAAPAAPPFCTGQHCEHCGRPVVPAHALPYWYAAPPYTFTTNTAELPPVAPPVVAAAQPSIVSQLGPLV